MLLLGGQPVFAATGLVGFLACEHLLGLELASVAGSVGWPDRHDPEIDMIAMRGLEHEARYLAGLPRGGRPQLGAHPRSRPHSPPDATGQRPVPLHRVGRFGRVSRVGRLGGRP